MIVVLSPAKTLNEVPANIPREMLTSPVFEAETKTLIKILKQKSIQDLQKEMKISEKIAEKNYRRFQAFPKKLSPENSFPALHCFAGDVYKNIFTENFSESDWRFSQKTIRIFSGLYGVLRPLDVLFPYRLEMGTALATSIGKNLYEFWGNKIATNIEKEPGSNLVINLASEEYFKAFRGNDFSGEVIHISFWENGKVVGIYSKRARGIMTNWILKNKIEDKNSILEFNEAGYTFSKKDSDDKTFIFCR